MNTIEKRKNILDILIDIDFFSNSADTMADDVGLTNQRHHFSRRYGKKYDKEDKHTPGKASIKKDVQLICENYKLTEFTFDHLLDFWEKSGDMIDLLKLTDGEFRELVFQDLTILESNPDLYNYAKDLCRKSPIDYYYLLTLYFAQLNGVRYPIESDNIYNYFVLLFRVLRNDCTEGTPVSTIKKMLLDKNSINKSLPLRGWCNLMVLGGTVLALIASPQAIIPVEKQMRIYEFWKDENNNIYIFNDSYVAILDINTSRPFQDNDLVAIRMWNKIDSDLWSWIDYHDGSFFRYTAKCIEDNTDSICKKTYRWLEPSDDPYRPKVLTTVDSEEFGGNWMHDNFEKIRSAIENATIDCMLNFKYVDEKYKVLSFTVANDKYVFSIQVQNDAKRFTLTEKDYPFLSTLSPKDMMDIRFLRSCDGGLFAEWVRVGNIVRMPVPDE